MFKALHSNTSLKKLNISHNKLETEVSVALAEMLSCKNSLTELRCDIPEAGLRQIAKELLQNTSLEILKLLNPQCKTFIEAEIKSLNTS